MVSAANVTPKTPPMRTLLINTKKLVGWGQVHSNCVFKKTRIYFKLN